MATRDTGQPVTGITRRDFLKTTAAATAVAGCGLDFMYDPVKAAAYEASPDHKVTFTTCPYCSASCGQRVVVEKATSGVVDIYGDFQSPWNSGGLCSKGAGSLQLVNNTRRIGAWDTNAANPVFAKWKTEDGTVDGLAAGNVAYRRVGTGAWSKVPLDSAMAEIAETMVVERNAKTNLNGTAQWSNTFASGNTYNTRAVAFFGSSHLNNEPNYLYRKLIANFGSSNTEHQARI